MAQTMDTAMLAQIAATEKRMISGVSFLVEFFFRPQIKTVERVWVFESERCVKQKNN